MNDNNHTSTLGELPCVAYVATVRESPCTRTAHPQSRQPSSDMYVYVCMYVCVYIYIYIYIYIYVGVCITYTYNIELSYYNNTVL